MMNLLPRFAGSRQSPYIGRLLQGALLTGMCLWLSLPARCQVPVVTINITDNAVVGDIAPITVIATDASGITKVELSIDDQLRATFMKPPYEYKWDTIDENEGRHTVIIAVFDNNGKASNKRIKVEVDNNLSLGVKPHAKKSLELFRQDKYDDAMLEARKAYRLNNADLDAIRALAAATGGKGDENRALDLLEKQQRINNQDIGDMKDYPMKDRESLLLRALFRVQRAAKQTNPAMLVADLSTVYNFWREISDTFMAEARTKYPATDTSPTTLLALGDALYDHGDFDEALATYEKVPASAKEHLTAENRAALTMISLRRFGEAERRLAALVKAKTENDTTHALLGMLLLRQYRFEKARAEVDDGAKRGSLSCLLIGAYADLAGRLFDRAFDALKKLDARVRGPESNYLAASLFLDTRDTKRAIDAVFASLKFAPAQLDTYTLRGFQLGALTPNANDGFAQALPLFDFVLQRDPNHAGAKLGKAIALVHLKRYKQADPLLNDLTRQDRNAADIWVALAAGSSGLNEQKTATESLATARKLDPARFPDVTVPLMPDLMQRAATYRRIPLLTPALLAAEEAGK